MTWLKGNSTWGTLSNDLTRLICGEIPDASAVTTAVGDRWVREQTRSVSDGVTNSTTTVTSATAAFVAGDVGAQVYGTGIPNGATIASVTNSTTIVLSAAATASASGVALQICTDTIRTPAAKDISTGAMSNRTGYFTAGMAVNTATQVLLPAMTTSLKLTNPFVTDPSTSGFHRWTVAILITTANTVPGNYSTAKYTSTVYDADSGATISSQTNVSVGSGGQISGFNLPANFATLSDPSGIVANGAYFLRTFTPTYLYGIDYWPALYRLGAGGVSFTVAPPGVAGTDYDIVSIAHPPIATTATAAFYRDRSNMFHGLGIKTATGLGANPLYTVAHSMALIKMRIFPSATAGVLSLDVGQSKRDALNGLSTFRNCGGMRVTTWAKMFQTPASVTAAAVVQYWLSVTNDGVYVVLNADPGQTGKLGTAFIGAFTPTDPTYDVLPVAFNCGVTDYSGTGGSIGYFVGVQFPYWGLRRRLDGSEAPRDWQTGWMRSDSMNAGSGVYSTGMSFADVSAASQGHGGDSNPYGLTALGLYGTATGNNVNAAPARQIKPAPDGKWWVYGMTYGELGWQNAASNATDEARFVRGLMNRYFYIPDSGWGSGDELTDTLTGAKYLLLTPDYAGAGDRMQTVNAAASYMGGVAVLEA